MSQSIVDMHDELPEASDRSGMDRSDVASLVEKLGQEDAAKRQQARETLVAIGKRAVPHLARALKSPNVQRRQEAARTLTVVPDQAAVPALIDALADSDDSVRWLAAQALSALGRPALPALLHALTDHKASVYMCQRVDGGAYHAIYRLAHANPDLPLGRLLKAFHDYEPAISVPVAAEDVLNRLRGDN